MPKWTPDLAVGVTAIDKQHQEIFKAIDDLMKACQEGKGREAVGKVIDFLGDYVVKHFGAEEKYMTQLKYPGYKTHKQLHDGFIQSYSKLKEQFEKEGPGLKIVIQTNKVVVDWLENHIRHKDKELGAFLKTRL